MAEQHRLSTRPVYGMSDVVAYCECGWRLVCNSNGEALRKWHAHVFIVGLESTTPDQEGHR